LPDTQTSSSDHGTPHNQAKPAELDLALRLGAAPEKPAKQAELDLTLRLVSPQIDSASPHELVAQHFLTQLDQVPWEQAMQIQQAVHDQAGPSDQADAALTDRGSSEGLAQDSEHVGPAHNNKGKRAADMASRDFGSGSAGKQHFPFTDTTQTVTANSFQNTRSQRDLIEAYGPTGTDQSASSTHHYASQRRTETMISFRRQDQSEQQQSTMWQRYETHDQAGPSDQADAERTWTTHGEPLIGHAQRIINPRDKYSAERSAKISEIRKKRRYGQPLNEYEQRLIMVVDQRNAERSAERSEIRKKRKNGQPLTEEEQRLIMPSDQRSAERSAEVSEARKKRRNEERLNEKEQGLIMSYDQRNAEHSAEVSEIRKKRRNGQPLTEEEQIKISAIDQSSAKCRAKSSEARKKRRNEERLNEDDARQDHAVQR
jgi:hypothetical protein